RHWAARKEVASPCYKVEKPPLPWIIDRSGACGVDDRTVHRPSPNISIWKTRTTNGRSHRRRAGNPIERRNRTRPEYLGSRLLREKSNGFILRIVQTFQPRLSWHGRRGNSLPPARGTGADAADYAATASRPMAGNVLIHRWSSAASMRVQGPSLCAVSSLALIALNIRVRERP